MQDFGIPKDKIVLIAPPACDEKAWKKFCLDNGDFSSITICFECIKFLLLQMRLNHYNDFF